MWLVGTPSLSPVFYTLVKIGTDVVYQMLHIALFPEKQRRRFSFDSRVEL